MSISRVWVGVGLHNSRGRLIGHTPWVALDGGALRRGRSLAQAHSARQSHYLGTLIRHFVARAIAALARCVVTPPLPALLVAAIGLAAGQSSVGCAASLGAVRLAPITARAQVEEL